MRTTAELFRASVSRAEIPRSRIIARVVKNKDWSPGMAAVVVDRFLGGGKIDIAVAEAILDILTGWDLRK